MLKFFFLSLQSQKRLFFGLKKNTSNAKLQPGKKNNTCLLSHHFIGPLGGAVVRSQCLKRVWSLGDDDINRHKFNAQVWKHIYTWIPAVQYRGVSPPSLPVASQGTAVKTPTQPPIFFFSNWILLKETCAVSHLVLIGWYVQIQIKSYRGVMGSGSTVNAAKRSHGATIQFKSEFTFENFAWLFIRLPLHIQKWWNILRSK